MIILAIINVLISFLGVLFYLLPTADKLPFGIDSILVQGSGYIHFLSGIFPPLSYLLQAFVYYLGFLILLKFLSIIPIIRNIFTS